MAYPVVTPLDDINRDVPQPAKLELVIKLAASKTISITIPPSILATADEVISDEE